jgi:hypothetical protein
VGPGPRTITIDGVTLVLVVARKRVKNVNARLNGDTLLVSAPLAIRDAVLERIIDELARKLVRRVRAREVNADGHALALARRIAARFPHPPAVRDVVFSTTQEARWGSFSAATGTVRLHAALKEMPAWVLEAVVAHELAHAFHRDHSATFWALVRRVCPETDRARAFLAGISWLARRWDALPPVERALLARDGGDAESDPEPA